MKSFSIDRVLHFIRRRFWYSPRGFGLPVPYEVFDAEYSIGNWDFLLNDQELHRYMIILGQLIKNSKPGRILDVGCGIGRLASLLTPYSPDGYVGIDFSKEAINKALSLNHPFAKFINDDFEHWISQEADFDFIIFNECIGYALDPLTLVNRYSSYLKPGGSLVISYFRSGNYRPIWSRITKKLAPHDTISIHASGGKTWDIVIFKSPPQ